MKYKPVIILISSQELPAENFIEKLKSGITDDPSKILYSSHHFEDKSTEEFIMSVKTPSMFHEKKLVYIKDTDKKNILSLAKEFSRIENGFLHVVFRTDKESKDFSRLGDSVCVINLDSEVKIENHIAREAGKLKLKLSRGAVKSLIALVGEDLNLIKHELEKLALSDIGSEITEKQILELTRKQNYDSVFSFISAVSSRDLSLALKMLKELELKREDPVGIVSLLTWRIRQIYKTLELSAMGKSNDEIAKTIKTSKGAVYYIQKDCRNFRKDDISKIMGLLTETDRKLKSTGENGYTILHNLAYKICS